MRAWGIFFQMLVLMQRFFSLIVRPLLIKVIWFWNIETGYYWINAKRDQTHWILDKQLQSWNGNGNGNGGGHSNIKAAIFRTQRDMIILFLCALFLFHQKWPFMPTSIYTQPNSCDQMVHVLIPTVPISNR